MVPAGYVAGEAYRTEAVAGTAANKRR